MTSVRENYIRDLIFKFEKQFNLDLGIQKIRLVDSSRIDGEYSKLKYGQGLIRISKKLRGRRLREVVYHEMGHALWDRYELPRTLLAQFSRCKPSTYDRSLIRADELFGETGKERYHVSLYAQMNKEEDFSETLSVLLMHRLEVPKRARYGVKNDYEEGVVRVTPAIRKKLDTIRDFLGSRPRRKATRRRRLTIDEMMKSLGL